MPDQSSENKFKSASHGAQVFDAVEMECRLLHDADLIKMVLHAFMQDLPRQITLLKELYKSDDILGTERQAHSIKGACANVGALYARDLALQAENAARNANPKQLSALIVALEVAQEPLYTALQDYMVGKR